MKMKLSTFSLLVFTLLLAVLVITGCVNARYNLGYARGEKAYDQSKKNGGFVKRGYGVGYVEGFHCAKTMDDLDKRLEKLRSLQNKWDELDRAPAVTDDQFKAELYKRPE